MCEQYGKFRITLLVIKLSDMCENFTSSDPIWLKRGLMYWDHVSCSTDWTTDAHPTKGKFILNKEGISPGPNKNLEWAQVLEL